MINQMFCAFGLILTFYFHLSGLPSAYGQQGLECRNPSSTASTSIGKKSTAYANIVFWPTENYGFGHVALEVFSDDKKKNPDIYLSWAMGNSFYHDMAKHIVEPDRIRLPAISKEKWDQFQKWWAGSEFNRSNGQGRYGKTYHLLKYNCAHAVNLALKQLGYPTKFKDRKFGLTPKAVKQEGKRLQYLLPY